MNEKEIKDARFQLGYWSEYEKYCRGRVSDAVRVLFPVGSAVRHKERAGIVNGFVESHGKIFVLVQFPGETPRSGVAPGELLVEGES